jgi:hypothetical protein
MRPVTLFARPMPGSPVQVQLDWIMDALEKIANASATEALAIADTFTVTTPTTKHTLDVSTATVTDVARVLGTLLSDMRKRGVNSGNG